MYIFITCFLGYNFLYEAHTLGRPSSIELFAPAKGRAYRVYLLHYFGGGTAFVRLKLVFFKVFSVSRV